MLFTNARTIDKLKLAPVQTKPAGLVMNLTSNRRQITSNNQMQIAQQRPHKASIAHPTPQRSEHPDGRKKWGPPIWYFFHTIAEKIQPDHFATVRKDILRYIEVICKNLPCPSCAAHASDYMSRINMHSIQTKDDLKKMLFVFHNSVNKRNGHPEFSYEELAPMYSKGNLIQIHNHFVRAFSDKHFSIRLIADDMYRTRMCKQITGWFSANLQYFDK